MYCALVIVHVCTGGNSNIVHINSDSRAEWFVLEDNVSIYVVHHRLESCWRIGEPEIHDCRFEESVSGFKRRFLLVSFVDTYIVVPPSDVKFGIDMCVAEIVDEVRD